MESGEKRPGEFPGPKVVVTVDDRERQADVWVALERLPEIELHRQRLKLGDYIVDDQCVFERKTLRDFVASIVDGRLFRQSRRLVGSCPCSALILEGRTRDLAGCQMRREALQGALVSLELIYRLPVLRSFDPTETAHLLLYAGRQMRRHDQAWGLRGSFRPRSKRRRQLRLLQALPGLGPERASRLLDTLGTVQAAMTADQETLQTIPGIGAKTAAAIREVLQEEAQPYGSTPSRIFRCRV